jgi:hypothetical protein
MTRLYFPADIVQEARRHSIRYTRPKIPNHPTFVIPVA